MFPPALPIPTNRSRIFHRPRFHLLAAMTRRRRAGAHAKSATLAQLRKVYMYCFDGRWTRGLEEEQNQRRRRGGRGRCVRTYLLCRDVRRRVGAHGTRLWIVVGAVRVQVAKVLGQVLTDAKISDRSLSVSQYMRTSRSSRCRRLVASLHSLKAWSTTLSFVSAKQLKTTPRCPQK